MTIGTDDVETSARFREDVGAQWPFLADPERIVQKDLDIQEYTDPVHDPMIPYTLVLEPDLCVYKVYNGYWHWGRPSPEVLRQDLCAVTQRIRIQKSFTFKKTENNRWRCEQPSLSPVDFGVALGGR